MSVIYTICTIIHNYICPFSNSPFHKTLLTLNIDPKRKPWDGCCCLSPFPGPVSPFLSSSRATSILCQKGSAVGDARKLLVRSSTFGLGVMKIPLCMR